MTKKEIIDLYKKFIAINAVVIFLFFISISINIYTLNQLNVLYKYCKQIDLIVKENIWRLRRRLGLDPDEPYKYKWELVKRKKIKRIK